jgi:hypothetical protein
MFAICTLACPHGCVECLLDHIRSSPVGIIGGPIFHMFIAILQDLLSFSFSFSFLIFFPHFSFSGLFLSAYLRLIVYKENESRHNIEMSVGLHRPMRSSYGFSPISRSLAHHFQKGFLILALIIFLLLLRQFFSSQLLIITLIGY